MAIISIFSAPFSESKIIVDSLLQKTGWPLLDSDLLSATSSTFGPAADKLIRAMEGPTFLFNKFTHKRELYLAQLTATLSGLLHDNQILTGYPTHLIPREMSHVLNICIVADPEFRAERLVERKKYSRDDARKFVHEEDEKRAQWTMRLFGTQPWDRTLYDLKIPVQETGTEKAVALILENVGKEILAFDEKARRGLEDFRLAAKAELALVANGQFQKVSCKNAVATVTVDEYTMRFEKLEEELKRIVGGVQGIKAVTVKTGQNYRPSSIFANMDFELPEKVLLVDDEKDFVVTLSERLEMRDMEPAVAYSGEEALKLLNEEEPEIMVLDLKMPGIDGIEVLRRVKAEHPEVQVIILTGHGSEKDKELCLQLGAFAYLEKPVDIEVLSNTMQKAKEAIRLKN
jgi:CheY-like chemotaxis protein